MPPQNPHFPFNPANNYWNKVQGSNIMKKEIRVTKLYNDTVMELKFIFYPKRGWFAANIQPILDLMKTVIPSTHRIFDPDSKKWQIAIEYWPPLEQVLILQNFKIVFLTEREIGPGSVEVPKEYAENFHYAPTSATPPESKESIATQLALLLGVHEDIAKMELVSLKKKYREMARIYHPDLGGDASKMAELNRVWAIFNLGDKIQ